MCENGAGVLTLCPKMGKCHSQEISVLSSFWDDGTENRSYSQEPISTGLSGAYLSLIWWWHLGLPHFPAALIVGVALSTSSFLKLAESQTLTSVYAKILGQAVRNIVFPLQSGEVRAEKWEWLEPISRESKWFNGYLALPGSTILKVKPGFKWDTTHSKNLPLFKAYYSNLQSQWIAFWLHLGDCKHPRDGVFPLLSICTACRTRSVFVRHSGP